jgi:hypothetical protein
MNKTDKSVQEKSIGNGESSWALSRKGTATIKSVSLQRACNDDDDTFQYTTSLKPNDLSKAVVALIKAYGCLVSSEWKGE